MTLTSKLVYKKGMGPFAPEVYRAPAPYPYRGVTTEDALAGPGLHVQGDGRPAVGRLRDPRAGAGRGRVHGDAARVHPGAQGALRAHGILYIDDEVQSGMGRTGTLWGIEHSGVVPDLMTVGKSLASGMPLAGVVGRAEVIDSVHLGGLGSTYGGNPVACAAADREHQGDRRPGVPGAVRARRRARSRPGCARWPSGSRRSARCAASGRWRRSSWSPTARRGSRRPTSRPRRWPARWSAGCCC